MKKKLFIVLTMLFLMCPMFAKTVQCVKKYQIYNGYKSTLDATPQIQFMINSGWKVVSITPIAMQNNNANPTDYIIVVFEKEEE